MPGKVAVIPNGRVWGDKGVVITPDHKVLKSVTRAVIDKEIKSLPGPRITRKTVGVLTFKYTHNYFHWMMDVLPRIQLIRKSGIPIDRYIISKPGSFPYEETLDRLGIPMKKVWIADSPEFHMEANRLVVTDTLSRWGSHSHVYPQWACDFIRDQFLDPNKKPSRAYERIYISRTHASRRRITNEDALIRLLQKYGFRCIYPEQLSQAEQAHIFHSAKVIVSPHGAALTNLVFAKPGTTLLELFSPKYVREYYWIISSYMKLNYYYLIGDRDLTHRPEKELAEDMKIDVTSVKELLQKAGIDRR
ncbi:glycosyltransferase family 61 protein [Paenibacillus hexagrammi]|uniref:Glycosyltransferase family 61 protein n=1 Tax=Paenibacillus hexagrammi TaxID=2908839 RepID=A0ABY3SDN6_9BACL|nr:glycosyltransferase family 61 protein [Paenibacillus sp. YPD9-1]UJF32104.1 glycosyltransferase family 61 protein [Paenibacillus sp. YPD9-1]